MSWQEYKVMNVELVIFDFDGTLADTHRTIIATVQQTLQELGHPIASEEAITATIGLPLRECYRHYLPELDEAELDACEATHHRLFDINRKTNPPVPFPHVVETINWLREQGIKTTIASSRTSFSLRDLLKDMGIVDLFDYVLGSEDVSRAKPDPEPVLQTLRTMNISAEHNLVVGDMAVDILMGARAGCKTVGVTYGNGTREELEEAHADDIIGSMRELVRIVTK